MPVDSEHLDGVRGNTLRVRYHDGVTAVRPGDRVRAKMLFFWTLEGQVVYVPGVSAERKEMTFNGIRSVGVKGDDGDMYTFQVHPETGRLKKTVVHISRGPDPGPLGEDERFFENEDGS